MVPLSININSSREQRQIKTPMSHEQKRNPPQPNPLLEMAKTHGLIALQYAGHNQLIQATREGYTALQYLITYCNKPEAQSPSHYFPFEE